MLEEGGGNVSPYPHSTLSVSLTFLSSFNLLSSVLPPPSSILSDICRLLAKSDSKMSNRNHTRNFSITTNSSIIAALTSIQVLHLLPLLKVSYPSKYLCYPQSFYPARTISVLYPKFLFCLKISILPSKFLLCTKLTAKFRPCLIHLLPYVSCLVGFQ